MQRFSEMLGHSINCNDCQNDAELQDLIQEYIDQDDLNAISEVNYHNTISLYISMTHDSAN